VIVPVTEEFAFDNSEKHHLKSYQELVSSVDLSHKPLVGLFQKGEPWRRKKELAEVHPEHARFRKMRTKVQRVVIRFSGFRE